MEKTEVGPPQTRRQPRHGLVQRNGHRPGVGGDYVLRTAERTRRAWYGETAVAANRRLHTQADRVMEVLQRVSAAGLSAPLEGESEDFESGE